MSKCATCGKSIIAGGIKDQGFRFCSKPCHQRQAPFLSKIGQVSEDAVDREMTRVRALRCSRCKRNGEVDMHSSAFVYSMIIMTRFGQNKHLCCKSCALKAQAKDTLSTAALGWWGFPFGLIMTPISLVSNVAQMVATARRKEPSAAMRLYIKQQVARQLVAQAQAAPRA
jgi:hypothetical protein